MICKLATENGLVLTGVSFGASGTRSGELVFNTAMTGYQEILTDPSYCGQIVTMTFPLMGNYGVNEEDVESRGLFLSGMVVRELPARPSNHRATRSLSDYLAAHNVMGIAGVDTRAITRNIRAGGAVRCVLSTEELGDVQLVRLAQEANAMKGANLTPKVADPTEKTWTTPPVSPAPIRAQGASPGTKLHPPTQSLGARSRLQNANPCHIVAIDCGIKLNILRHLAASGDRVTVVPANTPAARIRELAPSGLLVGNGPGDPAAVTETIATLKSLLGEIPILGICLGHQLLALALGATTYKLKFGHHGANVPVKNEPGGCVEITSQNHGFAVDAQALQQSGAELTHINLNDQSVEGFCHTDKQVAGIQFHPEASPGPNDASHILRSFIQTIRTNQPLTPASLYANR